MRHAHPIFRASLSSLAAVLCLASALLLRHVRFDYDFEKFFPKNDPELDRYLGFRERFGKTRSKERPCPSGHESDFILKGEAIEDGHGVP